MQGTKSELKILLSNMKANNEEMEHLKLEDFINKNTTQVKYMAGDLILYEGFQKLGFVLQVLPDFLRVLTTSNAVVDVKH